MTFRWRWSKKRRVTRKPPTAPKVPSAGPALKEVSDDLQDAAIELQDTVAKMRRNLTTPDDQAADKEDPPKEDLP